LTSWSSGGTVNEWWYNNGWALSSSGAANYGGDLRSALGVANASVSWGVWSITTLGSKAGLEIEELSSTSVDWAGLIWDTSTVGLEVGAAANLVEWVTYVVELLGVASWLSGQWSALSSDASGLETTLGTDGASLTSETGLDTSSVVTESAKVGT